MRKKKSLQMCLSSKTKNIGNLNIPNLPKLRKIVVIENTWISCKMIEDFRIKHKPLEMITHYNKEKTKTSKSETATEATSATTKTTVNDGGNDTDVSDDRNDDENTTPFIITIYTLSRVNFTHNIPDATKNKNSTISISYEKYTISGVTARKLCRDYGVDNNYHNHILLQSKIKKI